MWSSVRDQSFFDRHHVEGGARDYCGATAWLGLDIEIAVDREYSFPHADESQAAMTGGVALVKSGSQITYRKLNLS
jgi:hypothetical protein